MKDPFMAGAALVMIVLTADVAIRCEESLIAMFLRALG